MSERFVRILAPLDVDEMSSSKALDRARAIAREHGARLILMHAVPSDEAHLLRPEYKPEETGGADDRAAELLVREALEGVGTACRAEGIDCEVRVTTGPAARKILEIADSEGVDLIVIAGHRPRSRWREWLLGSTTYDVVRRAGTHVLVVH